MHLVHKAKLTREVRHSPAVKTPGSPAGDVVEPPRLVILCGGGFTLFAARGDVGEARRVELTDLRLAAGVVAEERVVVRLVVQQREVGGADLALLPRRRRWVNTNAS